MMAITPTLREMKDIFNKCQEGQHTHPQLIKRFTKIYEKMALNDFQCEFQHCLNYFLVEYRREPSVERGVDFITKFTVSLVTPRAAEAEQTTQADSVGDDSLPAFVSQLFAYLLQHHNAAGRGVRFRCCQLVHKLLHSLGENAQIDDSLYDDIFNAMMTRLRDKLPVVRVQAIHALTRLQDPSDHECPVIKAFMFLMTCDPHPDVRKAALTNIALSKRTLREVLSRTRDVKENIRQTAFRVVAEKVHIKALTIAQRVKLLQDGLGDHSECVREACGKCLLQTWLGQYGGNVLEVLKKLDVEESQDTVAKAFQYLYKHCDARRMVEDFDIINENCTVPVDALTCENSFYWRSLCQYLREQGDRNDELVEKILPLPVQLCDYMKSVVARYAVMASIDEQLRNEFILEQLVQLIGCLDLADTAGRNSVEDLLRELLLDDNISDRLVATLVKRLRALHVTDETKFAVYEPGHVTKLVEIIADIRVPVSSTATQPDFNLPEAERRRIEIKVASIRVQLNQLREELNDCVDNQDFSRAAELKARITAMESERDDLQEQTTRDTSAAVDDTRIERNDPAVVLKCLTIASEMLYHLKMTGLNPVLRTLMDTLIIPGIMTEDPAVRRQAIRALGLCSLMDRQTARAHFLLFLQICQVDLEAIRLMAMTVVFDVIMTHGLEALESEPGVNGGDAARRAADTERTTEGDDDKDSSVQLFDSDSGGGSDDSGTGAGANGAKPAQTVQSIVSVLTSWIDIEDAELRTCAAQGLAKLMAVGCVSSAKLLSRLLILWYNPLTEDDTMLRHFLGTFFPVYAFDCAEHQEIVEESVMPTLRTLLEAPVSSPLSGVNVKNVLDLLVQLCDWRHLAVNRSRPTDKMLEHNLHNSLAVKLCNEVLSEPESDDVGVFCWALNQLVLNPGELATMQDLLVMAKRMGKVVVNRTVLRSVDRFTKSLRTLIAVQPPSTPLSQPRDVARSRVRRATTRQPATGDASDPEPSIDDYSPAESNVQEDRHHDDDATDTGHSDATSCHGDPTSSHGDTASSYGNQSQVEEEEGVEAGMAPSSLDSEPSTDQSEASMPNGQRSGRSRKVKGRLTQTAAAPPERRTTRRSVAAQSTPSVDNESENDIFASPAASTRSSRATRAAAQRKAPVVDITDSDSDYSPHSRQRTKRKAPVVLSDIENDYL